MIFLSMLSKYQQHIKIENSDKDSLRFHTLDTCVKATFIQDLQSSCHAAMLQLRSAELSKILLPARCQHMLLLLHSGRHWTTDIKRKHQQPEGDSISSS